MGAGVIGAAALAFVTGGSWTRLTATLLTGMAIGGWGAWQVQGWRAASAELQRTQAAQEQHSKNEKRRYIASESYQKESARDRIVYQTRTRILRQVVERPVYRHICLDADGVQQINDAIAGVAPAP